MTLDYPEGREKLLSASKELENLHRELHIGKRSAGWKFHFRGYKNLFLTTFTNWKTYINQEHVTIKDEYGRVYSADEFIQEVLSTSGGLTSAQYALTPEGRKYGYPDPLRAQQKWVDPAGFDFSSYEFS